MKWTKFFVLVARTDWPQDYTDFFDQIYELIQSQEYSHLGLTFLLISSEELTNPRFEHVYSFILITYPNNHIGRMLLTHNVELFSGHRCYNKLLNQSVSSPHSYMPTQSKLRSLV